MFSASLYITVAGTLLYFVLASKCVPRCKEEANWGHNITDKTNNE